MRGGPDTVEKLRRHSARTASAWQLDGEPLYGVSVYCALDEVGRGSLDRILSEMHSYRIVYLSTVGALVAGGFELLATGSRPHFTVRTWVTIYRTWNGCLPCLAKSGRMSTTRGSEEVGDEQTVATG